MFKPPVATRFVRVTVWEAMTPEQMAERYAAGATMDELGMLTGIGAYRVRRTLVSLGVTIRTRGTVRNTKDKT